MCCPGDLLGVGFGELGSVGCVPSQSAGSIDSHTTASNRANSRMNGLPKICMNCGTPMPNRAKSGERGPDIAWMVHCRDCAALALDSMRIVAQRPSGAAIDIWRCRRCGTTRSCRPGWLTRCMICLDERTVLGRKYRSALARDLDRFSPQLGNRSPSCSAFRWRRWRRKMCAPMTHFTQ